MTTTALTPPPNRRHCVDISGGHRCSQMAPTPTYITILWGDRRAALVAAFPDESRICRQSN